MSMDSHVRDLHTWVEMYIYVYIYTHVCKNAYCLCGCVGAWEYVCVNAHTNISA